MLFKSSYKCWIEYSLFKNVIDFDLSGTEYNSHLKNFNSFLSQVKDQGQKPRFLKLLMKAE